jgi:hypothetical protein
MTAILATDLFVMVDDPSGSAETQQAAVSLVDARYAVLSNNLSDLASAATARTNLGLGTMSTQAADAVAITGGSVAGVTDITVADGGTGASNAAGARTNLGLVIGTDVLAEQTIGIADNNLLEVDGSPNDDEYARFTASGLEGRTTNEMLSDLGISGTFTPAYGSLYLHEATVNVDISGVGQGVYVKITGMTTGLTSNVTINSDAFNVDTVGVYYVSWSISADSQGTNKDYQTEIYVNNVQQADGSGRRLYGAGGDVGTSTGSAILNITNTGHDIDLRIKELGSGSGSDLDIFNLSFNVHRLA